MHRIKQRNKVNMMKKLQKKKKFIKEKNDFENKKNYPKNAQQASEHEYAFWNTQPVSKLDECIGLSKPIDSNICEEFSETATKLPNGYKWVTLNATTDTQLKEMETFLNNNYVEDNSGDFRLKYSSDFLKWVFSRPTANPICLGIRATTNGMLAGLITSTSAKNQVFQKQLHVAEIDFLCVHSSLRQKRLTPILIKEITRLLKEQNIKYAMYSAVNYLPKPFTTLKYYHRPLNVDSLVETNFTSVHGKVKVEDVKRSMSLPKNLCKNFIKLQKEHLQDAQRVLEDYFGKSTCHPIYSPDEFEHVFYNNKFVTSYVMLDDDGDVVDFISYYKLQLSVLNNKRNQNYPILNCGYLFYYSSNLETVFNMVHNMLIVAKREGMDVFNAFDCMENKLMFDSLKFEEGTGSLHYYMYNYNCVEMDPIQVSKFII
jgi:glycylpeptide N-tetradecanoyltransferase